MSMFLGAITILGIAVALFLLFRFIFTKKKQKTKSGEMASDEVLNKEVSHFDTKTGGEKSEGNEEDQIEKSDNNKEIR
ncbi:MAG: hypothetical protein WD426_04180 [Anditalea sp.]